MSDLVIQGLLACVAVGVAGALGVAAAGLLRARRASRGLRPARVEPERGAPAAREPAVLAPPPPPEPAPEPPRAVARQEPDLRARLAKTRDALVGRLEGLLRGRTRLDSGLLDEIETTLFGADVGVRTAEDLLAAARGAGSPDEVRARLEARALELVSANRGAPPALGKPHVVLVVGVNGSGKTTTIAKLAARWRREGRSVILAAADTYRAAAIDQLAVWAERAGAEIVRGEPGGDPAAVAFDAVRAARARSLDVVLVDTAGRLQTQAGLMQELAKIGRVLKKEVPDAPHETLLVLDANTGQNAIRQAQEFTKSTRVSGIVLTKLDGTAKGGVVLGIAQEIGIPVRYVGIGEGLDDLIDFDPRAFVAALFEG
jgi:fused signal recognition particle receptor